MRLRELQALCHSMSMKAGWWNDVTHENVNHVVPAKMCLIHSEISEAMEGFRKDLKDDKLPHRDACEVELADAVIRICDLAGFLGYDLEYAVFEKMDYNRNRADHKLENRAKPGGKKF